MLCTYFQKVSCNMAKNFKLQYFENMNRIRYNNNTFTTMCTLLFFNGSITTVSNFNIPKNVYSISRYIASA